MKDEIMVFLRQSQSEEESAKVAQEIAALIQFSDKAMQTSQERGESKGITPAPCFCFYGDLGAGKSFLCRNIIRDLCGDSEMVVPSPTFTLVQTYSAANHAPIAHYDLYRLEAAEDVFDLGWDDDLADGVSLIEWPERAERNLPCDRVEIHIELLSATERRIKIQGLGRWAGLCEAYMRQKNG